MGLRTFFKSMSQTYRIVNEREQELDFRKLEPDRWLPAPVDFGKYRIVFIENVPNGFLANVFTEGRLLGTTKVTRWLERGVLGPEEGRELKLKLSIGDMGVIRMSEIEHDEPPSKE
jgi:hypothetical protein